jgi:8-oxo-dGTP pyrophosphatase MutT (NUDIX family)
MSAQQQNVILRAQIAALPYRIDRAGRPEILLITSRETRRWVIPKGWPMKDIEDHHAAAQEAFEEAGVTGRVGLLTVGAYFYWKRRRTRSDLCEVDVYQLEVSEELEDWPERSQRQRSWFSREEAADRVDEPGLREILKRFHPQREALNEL